MAPGGRAVPCALVDAAALGRARGRALADVLAGLSRRQLGHKRAAGGGGAKEAFVEVDKSRARVQIYTERHCLVRERSYPLDRVAGFSVLVPNADQNRRFPEIKPDLTERVVSLVIEKKNKKSCGSGSHKRREFILVFDDKREMLVMLDAFKLIKHQEKRKDMGRKCS